MKQYSSTKLAIGVVSVLAVSLSWNALRAAPDSAKVDGKNIRVEFDNKMHSHVIAKFDGKETLLGAYEPSETVTVDGKELEDFTLTGSKQQNVKDKLGSGKQTTLTGMSNGVEKTAVVTVYDKYPQMAFFKVKYTNKGKTELKVTAWKNNHYEIDAQDGAAQPAFWSYQAGSTSKRNDWVLPLKANFKAENFLGMNNTDYGGGTPILDVWRRDVGLAIGHVEMTAKDVSTPVAAPDATHANIGLTYKVNDTLKPGASMETFRSFASVHQGDHFQTLKEYSKVMQDQGVKFGNAPEAAFEPIWCAWGYGRTFVPAQVVGALPVVKRLGFTWVGVDDGWQDFDGDWGLVKSKFPNGDADMKSLVDKIHAQGFKAQLWWAPLAAKPDSQVAKNHPEMLLLNADGSKQKISYWNDWYFCPSDKAAIEHHRQLVVKMFRDWGYDGLKLDGQHMNGVPPCFNPAHHHKRPEESVEDLANFFKMIQDTAKSIKPDALVEFCPCGTSFNFYSMPNYNMSVASDPTNARTSPESSSSFQVRTKGKSLKALQGEGMAYFGDHVELSDGQSDFASTVGVGGVVGTEFTWPVGSGHRRMYLKNGKNIMVGEYKVEGDKVRYFNADKSAWEEAPLDSVDLKRTEAPAGGRSRDLTAEKEAIWKKWIDIYHEKMLSRGEYEGTLYDIGFYRPEAHAIKKPNGMYYAFYAPDFKGQVELRGLGNGTFTVRDYENGKDLGTVQGPVGKIDVQFSKHLLIEAKPK